jgi:HAD superfamily hydrolase (TIGR01493 family)
MTSPSYARPDFAAVTAMALDYAVAALVLPIDAEGRAELAREYERLTPYADARPTLERLAPRPRWILSNGTRAMLDPLVAAAGLGDVLDGVISVDDAGVYKPSPRVYALAVERLRLAPEAIAFVSRTRGMRPARRRSASPPSGSTAPRCPSSVTRRRRPIAVGSLADVADIVTSRSRPHLGDARRPPSIASGTREALAVGEHDAPRRHRLGERHRHDQPAVVLRA